MKRILISLLALAVFTCSACTSAVPAASPLPSRSINKLESSPLHERWDRAEHLRSQG